MDSKEKESFGVANCLALTIIDAGDQGCQTVFVTVFRTGMTAVQGNLDQNFAAQGLQWNRVFDVGTLQ